MLVVLLMQAGGAAIAAVFMILFSEQAAASSALLGGVAVVIPSALFAGAIKLLHRNMNWSSPSTLMALEAGKFLIAAVILSWMFTRVVWLEPWAFFVGIVCSLFGVILLAFAKERSMPIASGGMTTDGS
ncbi:MAG: hypothetical protein HKM24_02880 [Gammaproteobacteria bacterium]|nr:hypothetical protein [Gammaproteobacteria bacterium]